MKLELDSPSVVEDLRIEILPLIDVIFCILTFFILAAVGLTRQQAISLDLPTAETGTAVPESAGRDRLFVSVDAAGQVYIEQNQSPVPLQQLYDILQQFQQFAPEGTIVLYAAREARYNDVIRVLDLLRAVGGDRVALATLPTQTSLDPTQPGADPNDPNNLQDPLNGQFNDPFSDPFSGQDPLNPGFPTQPGLPDGSGLPPISPDSPLSPQPTTPNGSTEQPDGQQTPSDGDEG
ncbi:biopolymer transporter ExbD [Romeria aff. gracilis LEGE 07310]|uniref:Biopolymer transporter ExbD n=1 Tax=Vasconcelosia minhoensis LEGE 07310 TaxID=915328 RepID=A0A8J7DAD2_9CYAN|nr:biopolymer transporter ExbD [Romeria gracilis]MBE9076297.1 biopolymer transporter ExbD [Romeria aff. gracilis LEGE 07310]